MGYPVSYPVRYYDGNGADLVSPDIAYNSVRNQFYMVFELTSGTPEIPPSSHFSLGSNGFAKLFGVHVNNTAWPMESFPFSVGTNSTTARDRNPVIEYSPHQHMYIVAFEFEEQGTETFR